MTAAGEPLDELFALPPEEFTPRRDALAKELKAAKEGELAAKVKGLRRPTVAAWALNQVARRHADEVEALIAAGTALAQAQARLMEGDKESGIREATQERRAAVAALRERAAAVLEEAGSAPAGHLDEIAASLEAASADPDAGEELRRGWLSKPRPAPSGLGLGLLPPGDDEAPAPARERKGAAAPPPDEADRDAGGQGDAPPSGEGEAEDREAAREAAERRLADARAARDEASGREARGERAAAAARGRVDTLRQELQDAQAACEAADAEVVAASDALRAAEDEVAAAGGL